MHWNNTSLTSLKIIAWSVFWMLVLIIYIHQQLFFFIFRNFPESIRNETNFLILPVISIVASFLAIRQKRNDYLSSFLYVISLFTALAFINSLIANFACDTCNSALMKKRVPEAFFPGLVILLGSQYVVFRNILFHQEKSKQHLLLISVLIFTALLAIHKYIYCSYEYMVC